MKFIFGGLLGIVVLTSGWPRTEAKSVLVSTSLGESVQDTTTQLLEVQIPDSSTISKDSLGKLVPYLDKVEADSPRELVLLYMVLILIATWLSEDLACIGAGLMVAQGMIEFWPAAMAAMMGIYLGDFTLYIAGRLLGTRIFGIPPFKVLC